MATSTITALANAAPVAGDFFPFDQAAGGVTKHCTLTVLVGAGVAPSGVTLAASGTLVTVQAQAATDVPLVLKGAAAQSGNYIEVRTNAAALLAYWTAAGTIGLPDTAGGTPALFFTADPGTGIARDGSATGMDIIHSSGIVANFNSAGLTLTSTCRLGFSHSSVTQGIWSYFAYAAEGVIKTCGPSDIPGWIQNSAGRATLNSDVTNNTATLANLTDLTRTLIAGRKYTGMLALPINDSTAVDGAKFDLNGGTATVTMIEYGFAAALGATLGTRTSTALATSINLTALADTNDVWTLIPVTLVCNALGTIIPRAAQNSHSVGTLTVRAGGFFWLEDMP